jgi:hypothetical protein
MGRRALVPPGRGAPGRGALARQPDLPEALAAAAGAGPGAAHEWRIHFHVPLFAQRLDEQGLLLTTQPDLERVLRLARTARSRRTSRSRPTRGR